MIAIDIPPALAELWWVSLLIGGPALCAVLWEKHQDRKARKNEIRWIVIPPYDVFGKKMAQEIRDDFIFKTVEEYRNGTD